MTASKSFPTIQRLEIHRILFEPEPQAGSDGAEILKTSPHRILKMPFFFFSLIRSVP